MCFQKNLKRYGTSCILDSETSDSVSKGLKVFILFLYIDILLLTYFFVSVTSNEVIISTIINYQLIKMSYRYLVRDL